MGTDKRYPKTPICEIDLNMLKTVSLHERDGKISAEDLGNPTFQGAHFHQWLQALPSSLAAADLVSVAEAIVKARSKGKGVLLGMGAHPVKAGLGPVIAAAIEDGIFTGLATNGATIIHDYELALTGRTSENVDEALPQGTFGMAEETARTLNLAIRKGADSGEGIGRSIGRLIADGKMPYASYSILAAAYRNSIPATVHVAFGTDIIHMHSSCDGAATGKASQDDFRLFARQVCALEEGVFINAGSAVIIPEVFLKAFSMAINLGCSLKNLTTLNMDVFQHYRPRVNVVQRPTAESGQGYSLTGHHEILFPLLLAAVREKM
jgi:hypothetical protein